MLREQQLNNIVKRVKTYISYIFACVFQDSKSKHTRVGIQIKLQKLHFEARHRNKNMDFYLVRCRYFNKINACFQNKSRHIKNI